MSFLVRATPHVSRCAAASSLSFELNEVIEPVQPARKRFPSAAPIVDRRDCITHHSHATGTPQNGPE